MFAWYRGLLNSSMWRNLLTKQAEALLLASILAFMVVNVNLFGWKASYGELSHNSLMHFAVFQLALLPFFAIVGKEIREGFLPGGSLHSWHAAAMPVVGAVGGVIVPASIYLIGTRVLGRPDLARGWAVVTATDIAFSAIFARLVFRKTAEGRNHPVVEFLTTLAVTDDIIGIFILTVAYGHETNWPLFGGVMVFTILLTYVMHRIGIRRWLAYLLPFSISFFGFYLAGLEAALSPIIVALCMPHELSDKGFFAQDEELGVDTLNQMEHAIAPLATVGLAVFGFFSAGVELSTRGVETTLTAAGLMIGKPIGILFFIWIAIRCGLRLAEEIKFPEVMFIGIDAGAGFTVSLFVANIAFPIGRVLDATRMGALLSLFSGPCAAIIYSLTGLFKRK